MDQGMIRTYIEFEIATNKITIYTNGVREQIGNLLNMFLKTQFGKGRERIAPPKMPVYKIRLDYNVIENYFNCYMNFKHVNLREGIIMRALKQSPQDQVVIKTFEEFASEDSR
jgi:hypothetical protein